MAEKPFHENDAISLFLAYFGFLAIVPFLIFRDQRADPKKEYVYWHARQGLALAICVICVSVVGMVFFMAVSWIPVLGWAIAIGSCCFWPCYCILIIATHATCWVKAFQGQRWKVPGIWRVAEMFH